MSLEDECGGEKYRLRLKDCFYYVCKKSWSVNGKSKSDCKWCGDVLMFLFNDTKPGFYYHCFFNYEFNDKCKMPSMED